jgi:hypothetical protein
MNDQHHQRAGDHGIHLTRASAICGAIADTLASGPPAGPSVGVALAHVTLSAGQIALDAAAERQPACTCSSSHPVAPLCRAMALVALSSAIAIEDRTRRHDGLPLPMALVDRAWRAAADCPPWEPLAWHRLIAIRAGHAARLLPAPHDMPLLDRAVIDELQGDLAVIAGHAISAEASQRNPDTTR